MRDLFLSVLLGIVLGWISFGAYYEGFVLDRHREQITSFTNALKKSHQEILSLERDCETLTVFIDTLLKREKEKEKIRQKNTL